MGRRGIDDYFPAMRHRYLFFTILFMVMVAAPSVAAAQALTTLDQSAARIRADVTYLADDARDGRGVGTVGLDSAAAYVSRAFSRAGLKPGVGASYLQTFEIDPTAPAAAHSGLGGTRVANIVGIRAGAGSLSDQVVVVGAHYDHLGLGGMGSLDPDSMGVIHNGADDNASGTATMIEVARLLAERPSPANGRTIVFVAFTAEEMGLIGSSHYVAHPVRPNESTFAMVNLDMVGRLRETRLAAFGAETAEEFLAMLDSVGNGYDLTITASGDGFGRSDHQSFYLHDIPVLHFFTGTHTEYHRVTDDTETLNFDGAAEIAHYLADLTQALATRTAPLTFKEAPPPPTVTAGTRPWLGTIPDMTSSPGGVLLSGVTEGSPADQAGMQSGDILLGLGDFTIGDLYDMTNALVEYKPGDTVTLRVKRGDEILELTATLRSRS